MDGHDARAGQRERERVLEVPECGPEPAEQPWKRQGHPQLLGRRPELDRLDPVGNETWSPGHGGDAETGRRCERRQLAKEVEHVGLVARALVGRGRPRRRRRAASCQLPPDGLDGICDRCPGVGPAPARGRARAAPPVATPPPRSRP